MFSSHALNHAVSELISCFDLSALSIPVLSVVFVILHDCVPTEPCALHPTVVSIHMPLMTEQNSHTPPGDDCFLIVCNYMEDSVSNQWARNQKEQLCKGLPRGCARLCKCPLGPGICHQYHAGQWHLRYLKWPSTPKAKC